MPYGQRRVGRAGQHVRLAGDLDDVRRVAAAGALGVDRCGSSGPRTRRWCPRRSRSRSACRCGWRPARRTRRRRAGTERIAAGVAPQSSWILKPAAPARICSTSGARPRAVALAQEAEVDRAGPRRPAASRARFHGPGVMVTPLVLSVGPMPPPHSVVTPLLSAGLRLLRRRVVHVGVDAAGGQDQVLAGDGVGGRRR